MGRNFEKLIEHIINSDETAARKLFHSIVVSKSRSIYENLEMEGMGHPEEEEMEESVADIVDSVDLDQTNDMMEAEDDMDMAPETDDMGDEDMGDEDMGDESDDVEARVDDLESALDELKAEFEKLMSEEEDEESHEDEDEDEEMADEESEDEDEESEDEESEEMEEGLIREYTEKAPTPVKSEQSGVNTKSSVAGKNDMGGSAKNLAQGGEEKGRTAPSAKPMGVNDPKAAGKVAFKSQAPKAVSKEQAGINKDSVFESKQGAKKSSKK